MSNCPNCSATLSERGIFCGMCATQVRCKVCREVWEPGARACVECGSLATEAISPALGAQRPGSPPVNTFELDEDVRSRKIRFNFTDATTTAFSGAFAPLVFERLGTRSPGKSQQRGAANASGHIELTNGETNYGSADHVVDGQVPQLPAPPENSDHEQLLRIFRVQGETLELDETRLKATGKLNQARRLTYLFLYAHQLEGREQISREALNAVLGSLNDTNTRKFLRTNINDLKWDGDLVRLTAAGRDKATQILAEVFDAAIENKWVPEKTRTVRNNKSEPGKKGPEPATKRATASKGSISKSVQEWVTKWKKLPTAFDGHAIFGKLGLADRGMGALHAIYQARGDDTAPVSRGFIAQFLQEAFALKVSDRSLGTALDKDKAKVLKISGGYRLSPSGVAHVQQLTKAKKS